MGGCGGKVVRQSAASPCRGCVLRGGRRLCICNLADASLSPKYCRRGRSRFRRRTHDRDASAPSLQHRHPAIKAAETRVAVAEPGGATSVCHHVKLAPGGAFKSIIRRRRVWLLWVGKSSQSL